MDPDGRLGVVQTGARYAFGFGPNFYGIWDEHASGPPMERFPATIEGKQVGWRRFVELEYRGIPESCRGRWLSDAGQERRSNTRRWIIVGVVVVLAIVAIVVVRSGKGNKAASGGGGGGGGAEHGARRHDR